MAMASSKVIPRSDKRNRDPIANAVRVSSAGNGGQAA